MLGTTDACYPDSFDVYASALQPDGKVLLVGSSGRRPVSGPPRLTVGRAKPDGSPDTASHHVGPALGFSDGIGSGIAVAADGRIAVANSVPSKTPQGFDGLSPAFLRFNTYGLLDRKFGPNHDGTNVLAVYSNSLQAPFPLASNLAFSADRIIAAETVVNAVLVSWPDASGLLDPAFGSGGFASNNALCSFAPHSMAIAPPRDASCSPAIRIMTRTRSIRPLRATWSWPDSTPPADPTRASPQVPARPGGRNVRGPPFDGDGVVRPGRRQDPGRGRGPAPRIASGSWRRRD